MGGSHVPLVRTVFADAGDEALGRVPVLIYDSVNASGGATINKRVALEIGVVYRAARVEPSNDPVCVSILSGVAYLLREDHDGQS